MKRIVLLAVLLPLCAVAAPTVDAPPPPPVPAAAIEAPGDEVEVRIVEEKEATIAEYRSHGKLFMIKVTPKVGAPYFLIDKEGKGKFDRGDSPANGPAFVVPRWVLFEF